MYATNESEQPLCSTTRASCTLGTCVELVIEYRQAHYVESHLKKNLFDLRCLDPKSIQLDLTFGAFRQQFCIVDQRTWKSTRPKKSK